MSDVQFGTQRFIWPGPTLGALRDCNQILSNREALLDQLATDGYLLIRGLLDPHAVQTARERIAEYLVDHHVVEHAYPAGALALIDGANPPRLGGRREITHDPAVGTVLEADALAQFFSFLFDEPALAFDYKWLRAVPTGRATGAHFDSVYMGRGSSQLMTTWIPLGDVSPRHGSLAICVGAHNLNSYRLLRDTYGRSDVDRDNTPGWLSSDPPSVTQEFGGRWSTASFATGDVITFGMNTMHASTTNITNELRLSCDVRYQPASDPTDERWMGPEPCGHIQHDSPPIPLDVARQQWGIDP